MIQDIYNSLESAIVAVNPDARLIDDPIGDDDLADTDLDNKYKIIIGELLHNRAGNGNVDNIPAVVEIYKKAYRGVTEDFILVYDQAIAIRDLVLNPETQNADVFTDIDNTSIIPSVLTTNDKVIKVTLSFNVRRDYQYC